MYRLQQSFTCHLLTCGMVMLWAHALEAAEWGSLSGKFVYTGTPVKQKKSQFPDDQSLVIGAQGGIKNIFVHLKDKHFKDELIHPDYQKLPDQVVIQHRGNRIEPHATVLWQPHQKLVILNKDPNLHLTQLFLIKNHLPESINENPARKKIIEFEHAEFLPTQIKCNIHPWETSYLLVQNHPYFSITDETGEFKIKNLPVGEWEFRVWHEQAGLLAARKEWQRGRIKMQIKPGDNDLGVIRVPPKEFNRDTNSKKKK